MKARETKGTMKRRERVCACDSEGESVMTRRRVRHHVAVDQARGQRIDISNLHAYDASQPANDMGETHLETGDDMNLSRPTMRLMDELGRKLRWQERKYQLTTWEERGGTTTGTHRCICRVGVVYAGLEA